MAYRDVILADGPVGYWRLEDDLTDESGNLNHGVIAAGAVDYVAGLLAEGGKAGYFEGTNTAGDSVDISAVADDIPAGTTSFTYEAWLAKSGAWATDQHHYLIDTDQRHILAPYYFSTGNIAYYDGGTWRDFGVPFPADGVARHVALTVNGTSVSLYLDGVLQGTLTSTSADLGADTTLRLGSEVTLVASFLGGVTVDEAAIYSRALTAAEVVEHYDAGVTVPNDPPATPTCAVDAFTNLSVDLSSSTYSDPDGDPHAASQWQIDAAAGDFSTPIHDSGEDAVNLTSYSSGNVLAELTDYIARVRHKDDQGNWSDWSASVAFTTAASNVAPDQPSITGADVTVDRNEQSVELTSSAFSDPDAGDTHAASRWQVRRASDADWTSPVHDSGTDAVNLVALTVTGLPLDDLLARVQHQDAAGEWSAWSAAEAFSTIRFVQVARPGGSFAQVPRPLASIDDQLGFDPILHYPMDELDGTAGIENLYGADGEARVNLAEYGIEAHIKTGFRIADNDGYALTVPAISYGGGRYPKSAWPGPYSGYVPPDLFGGLGLDGLPHGASMSVWVRPTAVAGDITKAGGDGWGFYETDAVLRAIHAPQHGNRDQSVNEDDPHEGIGFSVGTTEIAVMSHAHNLRMIRRDGPVAWDDGLWHHFVVVLKGEDAHLASGVKVYIDGVDTEGLAGWSGHESTRWRPFFRSSGLCSAFFVGSNQEAQPFEGGIDEFRYYDRELTSEEVVTLYEGVSSSLFEQVPRPGGSFVEAP